MAEIEVVGEGAGFEPHKSGRDAGVKEIDDGLGLLGGEGLTIGSDNNEVEEILFAFELISKFGNCAAVGVGFDANAEECVFVGGTGDIGVEIGEIDCGV